MGDDTLGGSSDGVELADVAGPLGHVGEAVAAGVDAERVGDDEGDGLGLDFHELARCRGGLTGGVVGEHVAGFVQERLELGEGFEVVADRDGARAPVGEPVGRAAVAVGDGEALVFDQGDDLVGDAVGGGAGEQLGFDGDDRVAAGLGDVLSRVSRPVAKVVRLLRSR